MRRGSPPPFGDPLGDGIGLFAARRIFDALASTDKTLTSIDTDHYFSTPGARSEQADTIAKWIAKRWR